MNLEVGRTTILRILQEYKPTVRWLVCDIGGDTTVISAHRDGSSVSIPIANQRLHAALAAGNQSTVKLISNVHNYIMKELDEISDNLRKTSNQGAAKIGPPQESLYASENGGVRTEGRTLMELFELDGPL